LGILGRIGGWLVGSIFFGSLNYLVSFYVDFKLAQSLGGVKPITSGLFTGGEEYGGIAWTLTSFWGAIFSLPRGIVFGVGFILGMLIVGCAAFELIRSIFFAENRNARTIRLLLLANFALWVLRFPVPIDYSLFYWTAVKY
jgi:hypothetical protein